MLKVLNVCPLDYTDIVVSGKVGPLTRLVKHISWVAAESPTFRPTSVQNCWVIELFGGVFVLSLCLFNISVGIEAFAIGLSQIFSCSLDKGLVRSYMYSKCLPSILSFSIYILASIFDNNLFAQGSLMTIQYLEHVYTPNY